MVCIYTVHETAILYKFRLGKNKLVRAALMHASVLLIGKHLHVKHHCVFVFHLDRLCLKTLEMLLLKGKFTTCARKDVRGLLNAILACKGLDICADCLKVTKNIVWCLERTRVYWSRAILLRSPRLSFCPDLL